MMQDKYAIILYFGSKKWRIYKMSDMVSCHLNKFLKVCFNFYTI